MKRPFNPRNVATGLAAFALAFALGCLFAGLRRAPAPAAGHVVNRGESVTLSWATTPRAAIRFVSVGVGGITLDVPPADLCGASEAAAPAEIEDVDGVALHALLENLFPRSRFSYAPGVRDLPVHLRLSNVTRGQLASVALQVNELTATCSDPDSALGTVRITRKPVEQTTPPGSSSR